MLPPKTLIDLVSGQAAKLMAGDTSVLSQPRQELEAQLRVLVQGALARLDLVTRDEFEQQALVLAHTRKRLELLEQKVLELEQRTVPLDPAL